MARSIEDATFTTGSDPKVLVVTCQRCGWSDRFESPIPVVPSPANLMANASRLLTDHRRKSCQ